MVLIDKIKLRSARELLWYGTCTVFGFEETVDPITGITTVNDNAMLFDSIPCKLSHTKIGINDQTEGPATLDHTIKLSLGNEYDIPSGCTFVVTQNGKTEKYKQSGEAAFFIVHQEIPLVIDEVYA